MKTLSSTWIILPLVLMTAVTGCQAEQRADARQRQERARDQLQEQLGAPPSEVDVSIARERSGASHVNARLGDGREFDAEVVGSDSSTDVAVIRIDSDGDLPVAELGETIVNDRPR